MPAMIFISVDLPAPFSPISACTVPGRNLKDTLSSARTPGNSLRAFSTSRRNAYTGGAAPVGAAAAIEGLSMDPSSCAGLSYLDHDHLSAVILGRAWLDPRTQSRSGFWALGSSPSVTPPEMSTNTIPYSRAGELRGRALPTNPPG